MTVRGHRCEICGRAYNLNVHHLTYDRVGGDEEPDDLIILCKKCHMSEHGLLKKKKKRSRKKSKKEKMARRIMRKRQKVALSREPFLNVDIVKVESVEEFLMRGGSVSVIPEEE